MGGGMSDDVRRIGRDDLAEGDRTPGMVRREAGSTDGMWAGVVDTDARMVSGWHHHGEYETTIYVVSGTLRMEFGPGGTRTVEAGPGEFVYVPKHAVHREGNTSAEVGTLVVIRAGHGAAVTNVDGPDEAE